MLLMKAYKKIIKKFVLDEHMADLIISRIYLAVTDYLHFLNFKLREKKNDMFTLIKIDKAQFCKKWKSKKQWFETDIA